ncbi:MAG TPA: cobalamin-dependent protein [Candidatus Sulfotelmatobacter sp.]|nr:cobalamin-dependent protein [Candidatus Sulfotelmatobacter sp.]
MKSKKLTQEQLSEPTRTNGALPFAEAAALNPSGLPSLSADLLLMHAPAFFDFRNRRDIYFPFLGTSGDVPITPLYEYFPIGFKMLHRYLSAKGHSIKIINLSTVLLRYPAIDVCALIEALDVRLLGIDLHWMVHVQGSLEVAKLVKYLRPDIVTIFGGISSTYYAEELVRYNFVDMVMKGYDTLKPMDELLIALKQGTKDLSRIPNLLWKSDGRVRQNHYDHKPASYGIGIDWADLNHEQVSRGIPILEFLSTQNAGCSYHCGWCGGSRDAFRRVFETKPSILRKSKEEVAFEFKSVQSVAGCDNFHFYAVGSYNEPRSGMEGFLDLVRQTKLRSISYEQFFLTPEPTLKRMAEANKNTTITLSPESHDIRISKLSGRGTYTNEELERWLVRALEIGIRNIDVWYFIGMPEQDEKSVMQTVDYCIRLVKLFRGRGVNPMLCPMIPFLDPASNFFEYPEQNGYRLFSRTAEEHRRGMENASLINRINYETKWLRREDLVYIGFKAVRRLMEAKAEMGALPARVVNNYNRKIDDALDLIPRVHEADCLENADDRRRALAEFGDEILSRNQMILFSGVANQAFPLNRSIGGRWFDEMGWAPEVLERAARLSSPVRGQDEDRNLIRGSLSAKKTIPLRPTSPG